MNLVGLIPMMELFVVEIKDFILAKYLWMSGHIFSPTMVKDFLLAMQEELLIMTTMIARLHPAN